MRRKRDIVSYFCPQKKDDKANVETEPDRDAETCEEAERATERELVNFGEISSKATEQEQEQDEDPNSEDEPEGDIQVEFETQTEDPCAFTSTGPSGL